jgi:Zn-dependent peptidase ImmA (M78 family)
LIVVAGLFARRFGPAFLMPAPSVRARFEQALGEVGEFDVRSLVLLAHQFDASPEAMCRRLEELELLADGVWESIKERGFKSDLEREVLGDPEPTPRAPLIAPRLAYLAASALERELLSEGQLCDLLVVDRVELRNAVAPFDAGGGLHVA